MPYKLFLPVLFLSSWLATPAFAADTADAVLNEAKGLFKQANDLQGAWVTTEKLIKEAEQALKKGDQKTALQLAKKAKMEADLSITQAKEQVKNWAEPPYVR